MKEKRWVFYCLLDILLSCCSEFSPMRLTASAIWIHGKAANDSKCLILFEVCLKSALAEAAMNYRNLGTTDRINTRVNSLKCCIRIAKQLSVGFGNTRLV